MDQLYHKISKSIVKIWIGPYFFHGFVSDYVPPRLAVMASAVSFPMPLEDYEVLLVFPDGKKIQIHPANRDIQITDGIALIQLECDEDGIDTNLVEGLQICEQPVSESEEVYTYSAYRKRESAITKGFVISIREDSFFHNCAASTTSHLGALVINKYGELVGLCTGFDRYLIARHASTVA